MTQNTEAARVRPRNDSEFVRKSFDRLSNYFVGDAGISDTLQRVAMMAVDSSPGTTFASIILLTGDVPTTGAFTHPAAAEIDEVQYELDDGPCLAAARTGEVQTIASTRDDGPWPRFRVACGRHGVLSTAAFPMTVDGLRLGALNLYAQQPQSFDGSQLAAGVKMALQAGLVIAYARSYWNARELSAQLQSAMTHRAEIEQAKGIIVASTGCTPDEAFQLLVKQSQHENRKVREIAVEIVNCRISKDR